MEITHLILEPSINIENKTLQCTGKMEIKDIKKESFFYLNEELTISQLYAIVKGNKVDISFSEGERPEDFFIHTAKKVLIQLPLDVKIQTEDTLGIYFEYSGKLRFDDWGTNYITEEAIELALYASWFPIVSLGHRPTFNLIIHSPKDFVWKANGVEKKHEEENIYEFENTSGSNDVTMIGIHHSQAIQEESIFWGWKEDYHNYKKIEGDLQEIKRIFKEWYGEPESEQISVALVPREKGGMYVRGSLIICQSELDEVFFNEKKEWLIHSWAHEIAHLWFCHTSTETFNNWLDEAMAEYSALMVCNELYGETHQEQYLEKIEPKFEEDLPAINTIPRSHPKAHTVYYYWGTLVFLDIRRKIGTKKLKQALKEFAKISQKERSVSSKHLIESLNLVTGKDKDWQKYIENKLSEKPKFNPLD